MESLGSENYLLVKKGVITPSYKIRIRGCFKEENRSSYGRLGEDIDNHRNEKNKKIVNSGFGAL